MTQPNIAFGAEPAGVCPLVGLAAVGTPPPLLLIRLRLTLQLDREVSQWKKNYGRGGTTWSSATTVLPNQLSSQLQPKLLDSDLGVRTIVFIEDVCVGYCNIEQGVEYVLIELSAFGTAVVVATQLVTPVYSSHVGIVLNDGVWTCDRDSGTISLSPQYRPRCLGLTAR